MGSTPVTNHQGEPPHVIRNAICDSTRWHDFRFRDDDIVIVTPGKTGTTWTQQIVGQLVFGGADGLLTEASPWLEHILQPVGPVRAMLEAQRHRRFIKSHLPFEALPWSPKVRYLYVARDVRDQLWSIFNHLASFTPGARASYDARAGGAGQGLAPAPEDIRAFYLHFLETGSIGIFAGDHDPWPIWDHIRTAWAIRQAPNVLLLHYANLKADLAGETRRIAAFLDIALDEARLPDLLARCSFAYMREAAEQVEQLRFLFTEGARTFIHKGTNGRWRDVLTAEEAERCHAIAQDKLGAACAHWLQTGDLVG